MMTRHVALYAVTLLGVVAMQGTAAHALSMAECSAKYKAAKAAGTLNGMKWNDFRKAQCAAEATTPSTPGAAQPTKTTTAPKPTPAPTPGQAAVGNAVFPNDVSPKYSSGSVGKARKNGFRRAAATTANASSA